MSLFAPGNRLYYSLKPFIPRHLQIWLRSKLIQRRLQACTNIWPILEKAGRPPERWPGWPEGKTFALVLTHDVDTANGQERCLQLMKLEQTLGFRSSFNFVPERYSIRYHTQQILTENGFEIGVHGLNHDGNLYVSRTSFEQRAVRINKYLKQWRAVGFRSPAMHHNLEWLHELNIDYDASTFDTDPFEPQPDPVETIFPFISQGDSKGKRFVELPYTLPQDFTLFILMKEKGIDIWIKKLHWLAENGGMALLNTHPDYMNFAGKNLESEQYPAAFYSRFLKYIKANFTGRFWHVLPRDMAAFTRSVFSRDIPANGPIVQPIGRTPPFPRTHEFRE